MPATPRAASRSCSGGNIEHIELNSTDPWTEVDGERSSAKTQHPLFSDPAVRQALALLVDRASVQAHIYGRTGIATGNFVNNPPRFVSKNTQWEFNIEKANQLLDQAGWKRGPDGIRAKDGKKLKLVFQTSINAPRQKTQAIVKQACQKAGIDMELKSVTASVYFSSDVANPDTYAKFYCDIQMFTTTMGEPDPDVFMRQFVSWEVASKDNKWQGRNITRWRSDEYDKAFRAAESELDPVKRAALFMAIERHGRRRPGCYSGRVSPASVSHLPSAQRDIERMGQRPLESKIGIARRDRRGQGFHERAELRELLASVKAGRMSRRAFLVKMVGLGLTAPFAAHLLAHAGLAQTAPQTDYKPTKAGGGGPLKLLFWQATTLLNPHFAIGAKDQEGSRIFYEPLAAWDPDGNLTPVLAAEIPDIENGGIAADGMSVTWKLKKGVTWHDGRPFTADDVVFNCEYSSDPATAATTITGYRDITVEKIDPFTVRVRFDKPTPFWAGPFVGSNGMIIPKHLFEPYKGANSREAPANLKPVGTGPYRFVEFTPGDLIRGERNPSYHIANRPHFDTIEMKGGGDAVSAARAVMQTGEYDFAWNMQVEDEILLKLENASSAKGHAEIVHSRAIEHIQINFADPWTEVDGERSNPKTQHPLFSDPAVRRALRLLVDRASIETHIYGRTAVATGNFLNNPERFVSKNTRWEFDVDKANRLLEEAGWKRGPDGIRAKDGKKLRLVFQTAINAPRQKTQAIIKQACQKAGIELELKSVTPSVYFSSARQIRIL